MGNPKATFDALNLVAADVDATIAFYRALGIEISEGAVFRTETGPHHIDLKLPVQEAGFDIDSEKLAAHYNAGWQRGGPQTVIGFKLPTRESVDERYAELTAAGHKGLQPPYDAFWGARYAIVEDPDGRHVGFMSPSDPDRRSTPPPL